MSSPGVEGPPPEYTVNERLPHALHECRNVDEFCLRFEDLTACPVSSIANDITPPELPKAIFLVGSLPLGMATSDSDIDMIVLVDSKAALLNQQRSIANSDQHLEFFNEGDSLLAGMFLTMKAGILMDLQVAITPAIHQIQNRLRRRGPELSENEIRILGRLGTGWLLWQSEDYLGRNGVILNDPALGVYCCTRHFVSALLHRRKAVKALDLGDPVLGMMLGRSSVELAYLAYFSSEGYPYLGPKWPALIGHARGASERVNRHPLLKQGIRLLFPCDAASAAQYLRDVQEFHCSMKALIEQKLMFRIAFRACPQIDPG
jgi:hypothetical protein